MKKPFDLRKKTPSINPQIKLCFYVYTYMMKVVLEKPHYF